MQPRHRIALWSVALLAAVGVFVWRLSEDPVRQRTLIGLWQAHQHFSERIPSDTPWLNLELSRKDLIHFRQLYAAYEDAGDDARVMAEGNSWRQAEVRLRGERRSVDVRLHGKQPGLHRVGAYYSLAVKTKKAERLGSRRRLKLVVYERIAENLDVARAVGGLFDVWVAPSSLLAVRGVGPDDKLYALEERLDPDYLERIGIPQGLVLEDDNEQGDALVLADPSWPLGTPRPPPPSDRTAQLRALRTSAETTLTPLVADRSGRDQIIDRVLAMAEAQGRGEGMTEFVDIEVAAGLTAAHMLGGYNGHGFHEANLVLIYDPSTGRIRPAMHRDHWWRPLPEDPEQAGAVLEASGQGFPLDFLLALNRDDAIRARKYAMLGAFVTDEAAVDAWTDELADIERFHRQTLHPTGRALANRALFPVAETLRANAEGVRAWLTAADPVLSFDVEAVTISPTARAPLGLVGAWFAASECPPTVPLSLDGEVLERVGLTQTDGGCALAQAPQTPLFDGLDELGQRVPRQYRLGLPGATGGRVVLENRALGTELPTLGDAEVPEPPRVAPPPALPAAVWGPEPVHLTETTVLERGRGLVLEPGTTIRMDPGVSLVVRGELTARGTADAPIRVVPAKVDEPFGSFAVIGDGDAPVRLEHFDLEGGREAWVGGVLLSGCLALHDVGVAELRQVSVRGCRGEDGLNIKRATVTIDHLSIVDNASDGVDLDFCRGSVTHSTFRVSDAARDSANGDGLDVSGASLRVSDSRFEGLSDKGLSIGEASDVVVQDVEVSGCTLGVAAKDQSRVYLEDVRFTNNTVDIDAYQKKSVFGGAQAWVAPGNSLPLVRTDAHSDVDVSPRALGDDLFEGAFDDLFGPRPPSPLALWDHATWEELLDNGYEPFTGAHPSR